MERKPTIVSKMVGTISGTIQRPSVYGALATGLAWWGGSMLVPSTPHNGLVLMLLALFIYLLFIFWGYVTKKKLSKKKKFSGIGIIGLIILVLLVLIDYKSTPAINIIPKDPIIEFIPNPYPTVHVPNQANVKITFQIEPGYESYIQPKLTINNSPDAPTHLDIQVKIQLTGGFKFSKLEPDKIPQKFTIQDGYENNDIMLIDIKDSPAIWVYSDFIAPVYHMDENTEPGSENKNIIVTYPIKRFK